MCARRVALDSMKQINHMEIRVRRSVDGEETADEIQPIRLRLYLPDELPGMLEVAGYGPIDILANYTEVPATSDNEVHVYLARKGEV